MKKVLCLVIILALAVSVAITGCAKKKEAAVKEGAVLAKVGDKVITVNDFNERINDLPPNLKTMAQNNKAAYLDNIIVETLLFEEATARKLDKEKDVKDLIEEAKKRIVMARLLKDEIEDKVNIQQPDIEAYYREHKDEYISPELFRASHILVNTIEEATEVIDKLNAGAIFEELAKKYSKDMTSSRGGDVGYFSIGQMVPEFEDVCLKLKVGEVSGPVKTQFGYHVVKLTDRKKPEALEFEKVKDRIEEVLVTQRRRDLFDSLIMNLKSKSKITVNIDLIEPKEEQKEEPAPAAPQQ